MGDIAEVKNNACLKQIGMQVSAVTYLQTSVISCHLTGHASLIYIDTR